MSEKKKLTSKQVTKALDQIIRDILKIKAGDNPKCFICGKHIDWFHPKKNPKGLQVNHFISRKVLPLRWDLKNVFPGCAGCNYIHQYNQLPFIKRILDEFGQERIDYFNEKVEEYKKTGKTMSVVKRREIYKELKDYYDRLKQSVE